MVYGDRDRIPNLIDWWNWHPARKAESTLSALEKIKRLLDQEKVSYRLIAHTAASQRHTDCRIAPSPRKSRRQGGDRECQGGIWDGGAAGPSESQFR